MTHRQTQNMTTRIGINSHTSYSILITQKNIRHTSGHCPCPRRHPASSQRYLTDSGPLRWVVQNIMCFSSMCYLQYSNLYASFIYANSIYQHSWAMQRIFLLYLCCIPRAAFVGWTSFLELVAFEAGRGVTSMVSPVLRSYPSTYVPPMYHLHTECIGMISA